jgi:hypothetical protein
MVYVFSCAAVSSSRLAVSQGQKHRNLMMAKDGVIVADFGGWKEDRKGWGAANHRSIREERTTSASSMSGKVIVYIMHLIVYMCVLCAILGDVGRGNSVHFSHRCLPSCENLFDRQGKTGQQVALLGINYLRP